MPCIRESPVISAHGQRLHEHLGSAHVGFDTNASHTCNVNDASYDDIAACENVLVHSQHSLSDIISELRNDLKHVRVVCSETNQARANNRKMRLVVRRK